MDISETSTELHETEKMALAISRLEARIEARDRMFTGKSSKDKALLRLLKALEARAESLSSTIGSLSVADAVIKDTIVGWEEALTYAHEKGLS